MSLVLLFAPGDRTVTVTGATTGASAVTGTITGTAAAAGSAFTTGTSAVTGTAARTRAVAGQAAGTSAVVETDGTAPMTGTAAGTSAATGTAVRTRVGGGPVGVLFGDAEAAVCDILRADARISAIGGVTVGTDLVGFAYPARRLRVTRTGGIPTLWMRLDNPTIAVAAYAPNKGAALDLASAARAAIYAARGQYIGNGLALYDVMDTDGLTWSPDEKDPDQARYVFTLALVAKLA